MRHARLILPALMLGASVPLTDILAEDDLLKQVESARAEVISEMEATSVRDADFEVSLPMAPIVQAVSSLNKQDVSQRTIHAQSTGANGKLWEDGPTWCNSFAELGSPDGFKAVAQLSNLSTSFPAEDTVAITADVNVNANVGVHWHFMGRRYDIYAFGVRVGNACPPGGGFGGHIGATGSTGFKLVSHLVLKQDGGRFGYQVVLVEPSSVSMTISFGFQGIGNLGIPRSFDLPRGVVASGPLPLMIANEGEIALPGGQKRSYAISLTPQRLNVYENAAIGAWTGSVTVNQPQT